MFGRVSVCLATCWCLSGCMIVQVGVTNPMPELTTVAVAPFFNQSSERAVDGRRVALAYASELQKIPGIEVIPVGVVETRMREKGLGQLSGPEDAVKLAKLLNADAVVIGSITEFQPYYPPRIGMSVAWYSRHYPQNPHPMPIDPLARERLKEEVDRIHGLGIRRNSKKYARRTGKRLSEVADGFFLDDGPTNGWEPFRDQFEGSDRQRRQQESEFRSSNHRSGTAPYGRESNESRNERLKSLGPQGDLPKTEQSPPSDEFTTIRRRPTIRGQSADSELWPPAGTYETVNERGQLRPRVLPRRQFDRMSRDEYLMRQTDLSDQRQPTPPRLFQPDDRRPMPIQQTAGEAAKPDTTTGSRATQKEGSGGVPMPRLLAQIPNSMKMQVESSVPVMSYTRIFDAADSDLVAIWRDYLETTGDQRQAGWVAQLYWSDNFLRFTARLMITEMFQLHGGEARRRIIFKLRKHR